ncbi:hypothetical protein [Methyloceanibacter caenitepidi]|uniref:Lipoprotein n=1 Tax=Methyloceanibacter caenitepidi TaxID=1384459 RepID=A0A0A8JYS5_9HYPH|nr:hypothetical protein [Methyloceanibacter caenitepidi]BAQ15948.1 hypothetical protein GL4_0482 [Methyloceanibacter caenitepidi]
MRFQVLTTLLLCVFLGVVLLAAGCTTVPVASMAKLSRIDFETTDLSVLRAAILLPSYLRPAPDGVWLWIAVSGDDGPKLERKLELVEVDDAEAATINVESDGARQLYAYGLSATATRALDDLRQEALRAKQRGTKGSLMVSVAADACSTGSVPAGPVPVNTYLKTSETKSFVPLVRNVDLRTGMPDGRLELKPCPR